MVALQIRLASVVVVPAGPPRNHVAIRSGPKNPIDIGAWGEELRDTDIKHRLPLEGADLQGMVMMGTNFMTTLPDRSTAY
jgi:hypothetical protein